MGWISFKHWLYDFFFPIIGRPKYVMGNLETGKLRIYCRSIESSHILKKNEAFLWVDLKTKKDSECVHDGFDGFKGFKVSL